MRLVWLIVIWIAAGVGFLLLVALSATFSTIATSSQPDSWRSSSSSRA